MPLDIAQVEFRMFSVERFRAFVPSSAALDEDFGSFRPVTRLSHFGNFSGECCRLFAATRLLCFRR